MAYPTSVLAPVVKYPIRLGGILPTYG